jgi:hypothetical protein
VFNGVGHDVHAVDNVDRGDGVDLGLSIADYPMIWVYIDIPTTTKN